MILILAKQNSQVTARHLSIMTLQNLVIILQLLAKKMPVELGKVAHKGDFLMNFRIFNASFDPEDEIIATKQPEQIFSLMTIFYLLIVFHKTVHL